MFHLLAFSESITSNSTDIEVNGVNDGEFSLRNDRFIFSERYNMLAAYANSASMLRARLNAPTLNGYGRHQIWPVDAAATIRSIPSVNDYRDYPIPMPMNEEFSIDVNQSNAGAEVANGFIWLAPDGWTKNLPRGEQRLMLRATAAVAGIAQSWSLDGALTFADNIKGGWYALVGAQIFDAGTLAFRFNFRNAALYGGRKMRPGGLSQEAINNMPWPGFMGGMGEWGRFHSFEPPSIQVLANATAASVQEVRLDVVYLGNRGTT